MKLRIVSLTLLLLALVAIPAAADTIYDNGPVNGTTDGWTINFGFIVSDQFTANGTANGLTFAAWLFPGDVLQTAEVSITSDEFGGTTFLDEVVSFTQSGCSGNQYGYNVCLETGSFTDTSLSGSYWLNLQNAVVNTGDPVYWDENSGIGCTSPGCPSIAEGNNCIQNGQIGCLPSESFTLSGGGAATVPEPGSFLLFGSGLSVVVAILRRRFR